MLARLLSSPRRRRRLAWSTSLLALACAIAGAVVVLTQPEPANLDPRGDEPAWIYREPRRVAMTRERRQTIGHTIDRFLRTAVLGRDRAGAWELATRSFKAGVTRGEWLRGEMPLIPYPASEYRTSGWRVVYSYENVVGADVMVMPKLRARSPAHVYSTELRAVRSSGRRRWLVASWLYVKAYDTAPAKPATPASARAGPAATTAAPLNEERFASERGRPTAMWIFLGVLVAVFLAIPTALVASALVQRRRLRRLGLRP